MSIPVTYPAIVAAVGGLVRDGSPWTSNRLVEALEADGLDLGVDPTSVVREVLDGDDVPLLMPLLDGRHALLTALMLGRTFTHRVTAAEIDAGYLAVSPDLEPLSLLLEDPDLGCLTDGTPIVEVVPELDEEALDDREIDVDGLPDVVWLLGADTLHRLELNAGDLVSVTVRPDGLELAPCPEPRVDTAELRSQVAGILEQHGQDAPVDAGSLWWQVCADSPGAFVAPQPPLGELLDDAGLAVHGDYVARAGFDFDEWRTDTRLAHLERVHDLEEDEAVAVEVLTGVYRQMARVFDHARRADARGEELDELFDDSMRDDVEGGDDEVDVGPDEQRQIVREMLELLHVPAVAEALRTELLGPGREAAGSLGLFAETMEATAPRSARPNLRWLRGKGLERLGHVLDAEQAYEDALTMDPSCVLALLDLAQIAGDRGHAERGLSLLRRAGVHEDDDLAVLLRRFQPVERTDLGRNDPCWCGSGRKYKVCHRDREAMPLSERASWLYQKAGAYLSEGPWRSLVLNLAEIRSSDWDADDALWQALNDPLVGDVALFEGSVFSAFLDERGVLLPEDEMLLAQQWLLVDRSVHELESVAPGSGFTARDIRTGERVEVRERTASRALEAGTLICARLVPAGDTVQCFGGMEVIGLSERDALADLLDSDPDPHDVVSFLSARFAAPMVRNSDGEPLAFCTTTPRSDDVVALRAHLDARYERVEDEDRWHELEGAGPLARVRATFSLDDDTLLVETMSERRMDRVVADLFAAALDLHLLERSSDTVDVIQEAASRAPFREPDGALDPQHPEIAAVLEQVVRQHEQAWLDESIPALGGFTPHEAAADPTRRPDLIRLLDSFPAPGPDDHGMMSAVRLREALGL